MEKELFSSLSYVQNDASPEKIRLFHFFQPSTALCHASTSSGESPVAIKSALTKWSQLNEGKICNAQVVFRAPFGPPKR